MRDVLEPGQTSVGVITHLLRVTQSQRKLEIRGTATFRSRDRDLYWFDFVATDRGKPIVSGSHARIVVPATP
ncbi:hypothetical protein [Burkholderia sp. Ac-20353]|uniref:thioesterase, FlK family n=1 Tax=Burkholderia sp. Ac-20353 TaxID=2703894 RepID=UPI00197BC741|nr:hypothetical protein [Burkholderia sp. Ac-20353]MBN3788730.1 hypothetical protein [Burkholderia sp. Ac-20353]